MKKEVVLLLGILLIVYGCSQADTSKQMTAEERLAEGDYTDTTTDHMVPSDYALLEQNIDILLQYGNMIGDRHYDELEAAVNRLERQGIDVSELREKLAKLEVAPRTGEEKTELEISDLENKMKDLENQFAIIKQSNWQVSPEGYSEIEEKLKELENINDIRVKNLRQEFSMLKVGGQTSDKEQQIENTQTSGMNRGCVGKGPVTFTSPPMKIENIGMIEPIGLMIGGHVTPIDHGYYTANTWLPGEGREDISKFVDIIAPASGIVTSVQSMPSEYSSSSIGDYRIVIHHTCTFYTIYIHVNQLSEKLQSVADTGKTVQVEAGEVIGRAPGFDFSVHNDEITLPGFIVAEHYDAESWKIHTADMFGHFLEPIRAQLLDKNVRQKEPRGGKIDYDIDGRLVGNWFEENTNGYFGKEEYQRSIGYWSTHLAFAYDGLEPSLIIVSMGDFEGEAQQYAVKGNKPDPKEVSAQTGLVKYELVPWQYLTENGREWDRRSFAKITGSKRFDDQVGGVVLVQMLEERKIRFESFPGKIASQVSGFTSNSKIYER